MSLLGLLKSLRQEFVVTDDGVCSQVPDSGKDWKVLNEETDPWGPARESQRSHLKRRVHPERSTLTGSRSSQQRSGKQPEAWLTAQPPRNLPQERGLGDQETGAAHGTAGAQGAATCEDRAALLGQEGRMHLGPAQRALHRDISQRNDKNDSLGTSTSESITAVYPSHPEKTAMAQATRDYYSK
uniref:zinc finger and SCAN domain-containing protein 32-like n=1 Tax=Panthera onca TaxID=9690 RepID=UPI0029532876|nr:zinc finger and SCAN domain-containing protein 32-like [Panthera onca]